MQLLRSLYQKKALILKVEANKVAGLKVGEKVVLTLSLKNNDKFVSGVVAGDAGVALDADGKYSFIMPAQNITVSVTLKMSQLLKYLL